MFDGIVFEIFQTSNAKYYNKRTRITVYGLFIIVIREKDNRYYWWRGGLRETIRTFSSCPIQSVSVMTNAITFVLFIVYKVFFSCNNFY